MNKKTKKKTKTRKSKKIINLYLELLEINEELKNVKSLYDRQEKLLKEIYDLDKGPQFVFEAEEKDLSHYSATGLYENDKEILVEVVEQNGHYVFHRPLRLSIKKAA